MVEKRLRKGSLLLQETTLPTLSGAAPQGATMIICWGSLLEIAKEVVRRIGREDLSLLHFNQVYPLHPDTADILKGAERLIIIENNATCQFARLLKIHTGIDIETKITAYSGLAFTVEELENRLREIL